jgi:hypothetical protein
MITDTINVREYRRGNLKKKVNAEKLAHRKKNKIKPQHNINKNK